MVKILGGTGVRRTISICKKVISFVCLFVCPIPTHKLHDRFASNFDYGTWENHGNVNSLVFRF